MESRETFDAPWGTALRVMSAFLALVLLGVMALGLYRPPVGGWLWYAGLVATPLLLLVAALLCMVRRYVLTANTLYVQRPGWVTRIELEGLESVAADAHAMVGSKRLFANGGLFVFAGQFRNRPLGVYRALVNDPDRAVVLRWPNRRLVISPGDPEHFVRRLSGLRGFEIGRPEVREAGRDGEERTSQANPLLRVLADNPEDNEAFPVPGGTIQSWMKTRST